MARRRRLRQYQVGEGVFEALLVDNRARRVQYQRAAIDHRCFLDNVTQLGTVDYFIAAGAGVEIDIDTAETDGVYLAVVFAEQLYRPFEPAGVS